MSKEEQYKDDRLQWIAEQRKTGCNPYPNNFHRTELAGDLREVFGTAERDALEEQSNMVKVAGRLVARRAMGGTSFATLRDMSGDIQLMLARQSTDEKSLTLFEQSDVGDIVGVEGWITKTLKGELTIRVKHLVILTKSLHPLPKEFYGLKDIEQRYRKRYLDLILNATSKDVFKQRAKIISSIRHFLDERGFTEVETPMMQQLAGGATARPFVTHHNALDMDLYLRVAPELFLKRLVVGGIEQVYEINRSFRNEGVSTKHNPEFTMLEFYQAYASYHDLMTLTEEMLSAVCHAIKSSTVFEYQGEQYDFSQSFERMTMAEAILRYNTSLTKDSLYKHKELSEYATVCGIETKGASQLGVLQTAVFEKTVEPHLLQPTFVTAFPLAVSPLARRSDDASDEADRFELFISGMEIANGFSELNDPQDQNQRLQQQAKEKAIGDEEAMHYDSDYIEALEYGLPPTAGEGIGIDRLVMLLTDSPSIRDVILFPHTRPQRA